MRFSCKALVYVVLGSINLVSAAVAIRHDVFLLAVVNVVGFACAVFVVADEVHS